MRITLSWFFQCVSVGFCPVCHCSFTFTLISIAYAFFDDFLSLSLHCIFHFSIASYSVFIICIRSFHQFFLIRNPKMDMRMSMSPSISIQSGCLYNRDSNKQRQQEQTQGKWKSFMSLRLSSYIRWVFITNTEDLKCILNWSL